MTAVVCTVLYLPVRTCICFTFSALTCGEAYIVRCDVTGSRKINSKMTSFLGAPWPPSNGGVTAERQKLLTVLEGSFTATAFLRHAISTQPLPEPIRLPEKKNTTLKCERERERDVIARREEKAPVRATLEVERLSALGKSMTCEWRNSLCDVHKKKQRYTDE